MLDSQFKWLPLDESWDASLRAAQQLSKSQMAAAFVELSKHQITFVQTSKLDRAVQRLAGTDEPILPGTKPLRLAILGSCTNSHLVPGIRVAGLRRGLWIETYVGDYGMYRQELQDSHSALHAFSPHAVLLSLDAHHLIDSGQSLQEIEDNILACWQLAQHAFNCTVIQQAVLPIAHPLLGNNEHRLDASRLAMTWRLNDSLRKRADAAVVHILAIDAAAAQTGILEWHDEALWHRSKHEIHPRVSHLYGDEVSKLLAAVRGLSRKCLVLDLDNTLWGGVIGDDGLDGIVLGQGHAVGESYIAFQKYVLELSRRGVILAVCSKNDENNALEAFEKHPEMVLRRKDIACFVANWEDKASNLRTIAKTLNIGIDSLVFADDNPFERSLVRRELPMVAVPELPEDPAFYAACIADAGYFEAVEITAEDQERNQLYRANEEREKIRESSTDMNGYLTSLQMELKWNPFDSVGLARIVQLINKTNQFNLTTRRYSDAEVRALVAHDRTIHLQFRLLDRFGDNGVIALIIGALNDRNQLVIDTWLMSCRVLGRQVEAATLNVLASCARQGGAVSLIGQYLPSKKNGMVARHYDTLGFSLLNQNEDGSSHWSLDLESFVPKPVIMAIKKGTND